MLNGKCPHCENMIGEALAQPINLKSGERVLSGAAYICPRCRKIISVGVDPLKQIDAIAAQVVKFLKKGVPIL